MADVSDGEIALREAVQAVRDVSFPGVPVYRGWPVPEALRAALTAKAAIVTVAQRPGMSRLTTRYLEQEIALPSTPPSLTVTQVADTALFAGACTPDQVAGVQVGTTAWVVRCTNADTPATIAASLAAKCGGTAVGASLTVPGLLAARTTRDGATLLFTDMQEVGFMVSAWCSTPEQRDQIGSAIAAGLSRLQFLAMPDGTAARKKATGGSSTDKAQNDGLLRRDLFYTIEVTTTVPGAAAHVLFPGTVLSAGGLRAVGALPPVKSVQVDVNGNPILDQAGNLIGVYE